MKDGNAGRTYDNTLREERARQTRERILEGVVEACFDGRVDDLSVAAVSKKAGISPATIYRHFPNREVLLEAVERRIGEKLGRPEQPGSADELAGYARGLAAFFEENIELMKLSRSAADKLERESRGVRDRMIAELLRGELAHLSRDDASAVTAVFRMLIGLDLFLAQRERFGATTEASGRAMGWAIRSLLRQLGEERQARAADGATTSDDNTPGEPS